MGALNRDDLSKLKEFVGSGNQRDLNVLLDCTQPKNKTTTEFLSPSPKKVEELLNLFKSKLKEDTITSKNNRPALFVSTDQILRGLLMIDSDKYKTPWEALMEVAIVCSDLPTNLLFIYVSTIERFLMTKQSFVALKNKKKVFNETILPFGKKLMDQILAVPFNNEEKGDVAELVSDLVGTLIHVIKELNSTDLLDKTVTELFRHTSTNPQNTFRWIYLVHKIRSLLPTKHMQRISKSFLGQLDGDGNQQSSIDVMQIPDILTLVIDMANYTPNGSSDDGDDKIRETPFLEISSVWRKVAFWIFCQANESYNHFLEAEKNIRRGLYRWNTISLKRWITELPETMSTSSNTTTLSFAWNIILLRFDALNDNDDACTGSTLYHRLWDGLGEIGRRDRTLTEEDCKAILKIAFENGTETDVSDVSDKMKEVQYCSNGVFRFQDSFDGDIGCLSYCGRPLAQMIFREGRDDRRPDRTENSKSLPLDRALSLTKLVESMIMSCSNEQGVQTLHVAMVLHAFAYFELPGFRGHFVESIQGGFYRSNGKNDKLKKYFVSTIQFILCLISNHVGRKSEMVLPLLDIIDDQLSPSDFGDFCRMLLHVPEARSHILQCTKAMLVPFYMSPSGSNDDDGHSRIRSGFGVLMKLIQEESWGDTEIESWRILGDAIVLGVPFLDVQCRKWVYECLVDGVRDGGYCASTMMHFLRAFIVRMVFLFGTHEETFETTKDSGDVVAVQRTVITLLIALSDSGDSSNARQLLLAQGRDSFLQSILADVEEDDSTHRPLLEFIKSCLQPSDRSDSFGLCFGLFLEMNLGMFVFLSYPKSNIAPFSRGFSRYERIIPSDMESTKLIRMVLSAEKKAQKLVHRVITSESCCSSWWTKSIRRRKNQNETQFDFSTYQDRFVSSLLELLFMIPLPVPTSVQKLGPFPWAIIKACGHLLKQEARIEGSDNDENRVNRQPSALMTIETIDKTGESFLSIASLLVREAFNKSCSLAVLEELLDPILVYCDAITVSLKENEDSRVSPRLISSLWDLYNALASDTACCNLIDHALSHLDYVKKPKPSQSEVFSLTSLRSESDVSKAVQKLRIRCLLPLERSFCVVTTIDDTKGNNLSKDIVAGILEGLSKDLLSGLDGRSGGIPPELYLSFCRTVAQCSSLLFDYTVTRDFEEPLFTLFEEVAAMLEVILVTFPLHNADIFRSTFVLSTIIRNSYCEDMLRRKLCSSQSIDMSNNEIDSGRNVSLLESTFDDCLSILSRWASLREPSLIPWEDIARFTSEEPEHEEFRGEKETSVVSLDSRDNQTKRRISKQGTQKRPVLSRQRVLFPEKEVWSWALSCSLLGLGQRWLDSLRNIQSTNDETVTACDLPTSWKLFYRDQKQRLQKSLTMLNSLINAPFDSKGPVPLDMLAMNMPSAPQLRLCVALHNVSKALIVSTQRICLFVDSPISKCSESVQMLESVCCLSAWLSDDESMADFSSGVFKWSEIALRKRPPGETYISRKTAETAELVSKISEITDSICVLHDALKLLQRSLEKSRSKESDGSEFHEVCKMFITDKMDVGDKNKGGLHDRLSARVRTLSDLVPKGARRRHQSNSSGSSSSEGSHIHTPGRRLERKRLSSQASRGSSVKPSKRRIMSKSRNNVVNMFMDLDSRADENQPRRSNDYYTDLDDFLVEG
jgi:hypothetical protein